MSKIKPYKKNWIILEIVRDFLYSYIQFKSIYEKYKNNMLIFSDLDEFVTDKNPTLPLFNLKESCHLLFRYAKEEDCRDEERLLDLAVGSIFHEAMKIRENLYQLEVYKPRFLHIRNNLGASENKLLQEFEKIGVNTKRSMTESMQEAKRLFQDTLKQLAFILPGYKDNLILMRFLLRNKSLLQNAYGKRKGIKVIANVFPGGLGEAYFEEGKGFLVSEHYDLAAEFFSCALKYKPHDKWLKALYYYAQGMNGFYNNKYQVTLRSFHKLLLLTNGLIDGNKFLARGEEVCRKIGREYLEDKKMKLAQHAIHLADKIRVLLTRG